jgi:hypothetical protein
MAEKNTFPEGIYYVESSEDPTVLLAMDIVLGGDLIRWFDTIKERRMEVRRVLNDDPLHFAFEREDGERGRVYRFVPLTLEIYRERVRSRLLDGKDFETSKEMKDAFELTKESGW